jgi:hypothetical protein
LRFTKEALYMKIEELISGKKDNDCVEIEGLSIPVAALRNLMREGYISLKPYKEENTLSLWGKTCTSCLTVQQIQEKA